jgi:RimJ/RimL family protein N-acetyltransferase
VVLLRPPADEDVDAIAAACRDPLIARFVAGIPQPYSRDDAVSFVRAATAAWLAGSAFHFAVHAVDDDRIVGCIGVLIRHERKAAEVGYWVAPAERARGIATRATVLASDWAFDVLGYPRVELFTSVENRASQKVAERAGFRATGIVAGRPGEGDDDLVAFLREERGREAGGAPNP